MMLNYKLSMTGNEEPFNQILGQEKNFVGRCFEHRPNFFCSSSLLFPIIWEYSSLKIVLKVKRCENRHSCLLRSQRTMTKKR